MEGGCGRWLWSHLGIEPEQRGRVLVARLLQQVLQMRHLLAQPAAALHLRMRALLTRTQLGEQSREGGALAVLEVFHTTLREGEDGRRQGRVRRGGHQGRMRRGGRQGRMMREGAK